MTKIEELIYNQRWLRVSDVATLRGVNRTTIVNAIDKKILKASRISPYGVYRVRIADLAEYLRKCRYTEDQIEEFLGAADELYRSRQVDKSVQL